MTDPVRPAATTCQAPIDAGILADYWQGLLSASEEDSVEQHLFACDRCGARLRDVIALAEALRNLARGGSLRMVVSDAFVRRAAASGLTVREYSVTPGGSVNCTVTAEDDLLVARLAGDMAGATRLDLVACDEQGIERRRLVDVPFRANASSVVLQESMDFAKAAPDNTLILRLLAVEDDGRERLVGEYAFHHTRSLPGPGTW
jgi:anti-sigma factor RsiW